MFVVLTAMMPQASTCIQAVTENESYLWHCRFGHLSFKGLRTLQYKRMVSGLPSLKTPTKLYTACLVGKQHRESIPKKKSMEGVTEAGAGTCRYMWPYKACIKQQQEVFLEFYR